MICIFPAKEKAEIMDFVGGQFVQIRSSRPETHREMVSYESIFRVSYMCSFLEDGGGYFGP